MPDTKTDIREDSAIMRFIPQRFQAYALLARIDRPIGFWLLALPGLWSIWLSTDNFSIQAIWISLLFIIGAFAMRSAGCVINDIWDRDLDKKVERTSLRPLAAEDLSLKQAALFLAFLLFIGLIVLIQMNVITIMLGLFSIPLIIAYPAMKRITFWPQAFLGITFNFGVLMGWSAITEAIELPALLIYAGAILWTLGYDTIYAHQDIEDDMRAGIKSTAIRFGDKSKLWVAGFYAIGGKLILLGFSIVSPWLILAIIPVLLHLGLQIVRWDISDKAQSGENSLAIFKSNRNTGFLILIAAMVAPLLKFVGI